jgi:hypothetical protein
MCPLDKTVETADITILSVINVANGTMPRSKPVTGARLGKQIKETKMGYGPMKKPQPMKTPKPKKRK